MEINNININIARAQAYYKGQVLNKGPVKRADSVLPQQADVAVAELKTPELKTPEIIKNTAFIVIDESGSGVSKYRAFFAVDENDNVVIRVVDSEGKVVRQIPPEEFLRMAEALKETLTNLFHVEA